ncbi:Flavonol synthase/flavanone 3-hydroxylase [Hibiscus syriacus]|uniref:Flavonol synthase/flavanone 3-hydroxylase n=1 Tax=Hibiscus syriacus TaxID=106335 RepID=A0A6A2WJU5_HIBSY|nr:Flavonol synthase/flavanone 3-hydroxylase [Hibiscus syriacus]
MEVERVQDIANLSKETIPEEFIRSINEQPALTRVIGTVLKVPIIDLRDPNEENLVKAIVEPSSNWGMFQVVNHGIPDETIRRLKEVGQAFFEIPQEEKEAYTKPPGSQTIEGYGTKLKKEVEGKRYWVDHLFNKIWPPSEINYQLCWGRCFNGELVRALVCFERAIVESKVEETRARMVPLQMPYSATVARPRYVPQPSPYRPLAGNVSGTCNGTPLPSPCFIDYHFWPKNPPSYRFELHTFHHMNAWTDVCLGLEGDEMKAVLGGDDMVYLLNINYYLPCPQPDLALGVPAHTDMSTFTVLVPNDVQGLEACRDDHWYDVEYIPNALIVHIGDQIEDHGEQGEDKNSWPVFLEPPSNLKVGTHPKLINEANLPKFESKCTLTIVPSSSTRPLNKFTF